MHDSQHTVFRRFYPHTFEVDVDPETNAVQTIPLQIVRMIVDQGKAFNAAWDARMEPPSARSIYRQPEGDEQETSAKGVFVVSDEEVRRRRIQEMTDEPRAAFLAQEHVDASAEYDFCVDTVRQYVRVAPALRPDGTTHRYLMELEDGGEPFELRTGEDLVRAFGGSLKQLRQLTRAVFVENILGPQEKKLLRLLSDSKPSSSGPTPAAAGPTPDATAAPVASVASASLADATGSSDPIPSGSTET